MQDIALKFSELADRHASSERALADAERALRNDKLSRRGSLFGRLVDLVTDTAAEEAAANACAAVESTRAEIARAVDVLLGEAASLLMSGNAAVAADRASLAEAARNASDRHKETCAVLRLGRTAHTRLDEAASACSSASSMEIMDAVSSNKGISLMSTVSTSTAREKLRAAKEALEALRAEGSRKPVPSGTGSIPDDTTDLIIDFLFDLPFDVVSILNIGKLDHAAGECRRCMAQLEPSIRKLEEEEARLSEVAEEAAFALMSADLPYLREAAELVPRDIRYAVPEPLTRPVGLRDTNPPASGFR